MYGPKSLFQALNLCKWKVALYLCEKIPWEAPLIKFYHVFLTGQCESSLKVHKIEIFLAS